MRRILFEWRGIRIYSYPALLYTGLVAGVLEGTRAARLAGLEPGRAYVALIILLVPALAGARLLFVAAHWPVYRRERARIWRSSEGGAALYGGLLLALPLSVPLLAALKLDFWAFWDVATVTMLVGMVFTKVGCLLNGCCGGRATNGAFGLTAPNHLGVVARRFPNQLLEAALAFALLAGTTSLWARRPFEGRVFLASLAVYGSARFLLEGAREEIDSVGRFNLQRLISVALVALAGAGLLIRAP